MVSPVNWVFQGEGLEDSGREVGDGVGSSVGRSKGSSHDEDVGCEVSERVV
tara:strand:- start:345 stop:497 length:153 start_codon:yes stop_codon:yes gene_type:complete